jgi:hypothetical protein
VEGVTRQVSCAKASTDQFRRFMLGTPACNCRDAGSPSRKLASADPVPSLVAVCVVKPGVNW